MVFGFWRSFADVHQVADPALPVADVLGKRGPSTRPSVACGDSG